jgi:hypothetical protein
VIWEGNALGMIMLRAHWQRTEEQSPLGTAFSSDAHKPWALAVAIYREKRWNRKITKSPTQFLHKLFEFNISY